ncbi:MULTISPECIES: recombinase family protein [Streptomyces]|uniref:recombinase family protein n=1 Tax=Streptomyces TaxID=1883 RepID=UPI00163BB47E|nr:MULTISPECIES: recombinase family protein [Streptomyces]MBC2875730.1 recombinase family protein [Streptomyces sp. TYQ1024]UBI37584.1 recombinase family protein [Streptomyces mobaraensis]UKW30172.1 recombinase family protein [Streptomyces sp. TYQ1024]
MLVPDPLTALIVWRIFEEYLAGRGLQGIAQGLTADGIPTPGRRGHSADERTAAWSKGAVRSILVNPRYAGRSADGSMADDATIGEPLLSTDTFDRVHHQFAARRISSSPDARADCHRYLLRGMIRCALCSRLMQGTRTNGESYYRCRTSPSHQEADCGEHPRNVYLREQAVISPLASWLRSVCTPRELIRFLADSTETNRHLSAISALGRRIRNGLSAPEHEQAAVFRSLGVRLTYADASRTLEVKVPLVTGRPALRTALRI